MFKRGDRVSGLSEGREATVVKRLGTSDYIVQDKTGRKQAIAGHRLTLISRPEPTPQGDRQALANAAEEGSAPTHRFRVGERIGGHIEVVGLLADSHYMVAFDGEDPTEVDEAYLEQCARDAKVATDPIERAVAEVDAAEADGRMDPDTAEKARRVIRGEHLTKEDLREEAPTKEEPSKSKYHLREMVGPFEVVGVNLADRSYAVRHRETGQTSVALEEQLNNIAAGGGDAGTVKEIVEGAQAGNSPSPESTTEPGDVNRDLAPGEAGDEGGAP